MANKLVQYLQESKQELKNVSWPNKKELRQHTLLVIGISLGMAALLGLIDYILTIGLSQIIK